MLNKANGRIAYRIFISSWDRQRAEPPSGESFRVSHDDAGLGTLIARMRPLTPTVVVLEATGGYEVTVAVALAGARLPVAVVNPRQIRDFTRATGQLAKTDALDGVIALFAEAIRPSPGPCPTNTRAPSGSWSPAAGNWWTCSPRSRTVAACSGIAACSAPDRPLKHDVRDAARSCHRCQDTDKTETEIRSMSRAAHWPG